ncbi:hemerythrin domain-containing protein [Lutibacter sp. A80]|uniref:hemerythrin domain-containing protein n=1 Tax=Lutibacter sp. A80 TaxID=2918453 RepID=UPI001F0707A4|nr:hemerythrin domain-containing protein [Lutibacter sp. A80]UMB61617.1 hemerythrin domain-containing protein [Lutibacter sp. A80]
MITAELSPSEITLNNRITEHVFNRFDINPTNTNKIYENTALTEVNPNFLVDVLNVFCNYKDLKNANFKKYPIPILIDYLKRSHTYYIEKTLPEIGQTIAILLNNIDTEDPLSEILYKFYFKYKVDLEAHFINEEELLFPYGNRLYKAFYFKTEIYFFIDLIQKYSVNEFVNTHTDTTQELKKIRIFLSKYNLSKTNKSTLRILLEQLKKFEYDLEIHAFIENKVLVPKISQIEQKIRLEINN